MTAACSSTMSDSSLLWRIHAQAVVSPGTREILPSPGKHSNTFLSDLACRGCLALQVFPLSSSSMLMVTINRAKTWPTCMTRRCGRNCSQAWAHSKATVEAFALCADGVNPFSRDRVSHSMWPITLSLLNLPKNVRNVFKSLLLVGIIPGPNEPKNMDAYLDCLVDELLNLSNSTMYDAVAKEDFTVRLKVCLSILDYPGQNKVCKFGGAGAYTGCSHCQLLGEWSEALKKVVYLENRRFLPVDDKMRESKPFPSSKAERRGPLELKTQLYVEACNVQYEEAKTKVARSSLFKQNGCKGRYALQRLPEHDRLTDVPVEPMHTLKDCVEHLLKVSVVLLLLQFYFITTPPLLLFFFFVHFSTSYCVLSLIRTPSSAPSVSPFAVDIAWQAETITTNKSPLHSCSAPKKILLPTLTALSSSHHLEQICCRHSQQRPPFSTWHFKLFWALTVCTCVFNFFSHTWT